MSACVTFPFVTFPPLPRALGVDSATASGVATSLEAMLLAPMFRPLFAGCDVLGEYGIGEVARAVARDDTGGFAARLKAALEELR